MADLLKGEMFMENYNEAFFRAKTNKRASITWVLLLIVACIYYGIKVGTGTLTPGYYAAFAIAGWAVYIVGQALPIPTSRYREPKTESRKWRADDLSRSKPAGPHDKGKPPFP